MNALTAFLRQRMDERGLRNRDIEQTSGLSRQVVSKWVTDERERITRLPDRETLDGLAKGVGVPSSFLLQKAVEALGLGYESGDFVNNLESATSEELVEELNRRLFMAGGPPADGHEVEWTREQELALARDLGVNLVKRYGGVEPALEVAREDAIRMEATFYYDIVTVLEQWAEAEDELPRREAEVIEEALLRSSHERLLEAARRDAAGRPSRGQRARKAVEAAQDDTAAS